MKKMFVKILGLTVISALLLGGCVFGPRDEKQAFIDATIEATCEIFQSDNIFDPDLEETAREIYKTYGFDADDDAAMEAISDKYAEDAEVQAAILEGISTCSPDLFGDMDMTELMDVEEEVETVEEGTLEDAEEAEEVPAE